MLPLSYRFEKAGIETRHVGFSSGWRSFGNTLISCIREGGYVLECKRGQWEVAPDHGFVVPAGLRHRVSTRGGETVQAHYFHLHCRVYELHGLFPQLSQPILFSPTASVQVSQWHADLMALQAQGHGVVQSIKVSEILAKSVGLAVAHCPDIELMWQAPERQRLLPVLNYIQDHLSDPLRREDLADILDVSVPHLHTLFIKAFGVSPMDKVFAERMQHARQLLHWSKLPVATVALRCGFADPFYFSRAFKRAEGVSPSQYRKALLREAGP